MWFFITGTHDKLETFQRHFHKIYKHQTWHDDDLDWTTTTSQATCTFDHMVNTYLHFHKIWKYHTRRNGDLERLGHLLPRDKLETLYLLFRKIYY